MGNFDIPHYLFFLSLFFILQIIGVFHTYFEVKLCKPKFRKLRALLQGSAYCGSELESELNESGIKMYSTKDLLNVVQASEVELLNALKDIEATEIEGKFCKIVEIVQRGV